MHMHKVLTVRFLTCTRCYNQRCINKSENAANRATKSSNTGPGLVHRQRFVSKENAFISETAQENRGVMWWRARAVMFHSGGVERQMRRIAESCQSFPCRGENWTMRQPSAGRRGTRRLAS